MLNAHISRTHTEDPGGRIPIKIEMFMYAVMAVTPKDESPHVEGKYKV